MQPFASRSLASLLTLAVGSFLTPTPAAAAPEDLATRLHTDQATFARIDARLQAAKASFLDVPVAHASLELSLAKLALDSASLAPANEANARDLLDHAERNMTDAALSLRPSRGTEVRAMLLDGNSLPKTEAGVVQLVDKLADAHFNMLVPEVYRRGYTIYPGPTTERDPEFKDAPDVLAILIRQAHLRGLEVQPWIWTFRARSPGFGNPLLGRLPALGARTDGKETRFLSAASPQARDLIAGLVDDLATRYDIDGLLLDYIRYDEEIPEDDISKTRFALDYHARHGSWPPSPIPPHSDLAVEWQLWREQQVHIAVALIAAELHAKHPRFPVGAAIFRGEAYARLVKMQHWRHWVNNRWVDWPAPMLYTAKLEDLVRWLDSETDHHTRANLIYPILGVHRMASPADLFDQLDELNAENVPGCMIFALSHFDLALLDQLRQGPFREVATLPHRNLARATRKVLAQAGHFLTHAFSEGDFETAATARMLHQEVTALAQTIPLNELPYRPNEALVERLHTLQVLADVSPWPAPARAEFEHQLDYAIALVRANQFQLEHTRYVPTSLPPIQVHDATPVVGND